MEEKKREATDYFIECRDITKTFGGTVALHNANLRVNKGSIHALLGENGAGKSTLMKIIIGLLKRDGGQIFLDGQEYFASGPMEAARKGISMIHQELNPEPHLTIAESIFLGREDTYPHSFFLNNKETNRRAQKLLAQFDVNLDPRTVMSELTIAQSQMVEIIKAISMNVQMIIMDEPTSSLDSEETQRLFETMRRLKKEGVTIIYISHRMEEIFQICDSFTVFRDGSFVGEGKVKDYSTDRIIEMMIGRRVEKLFPKTDCEIGDTVFRVEDLCGNGFEHISFSVRAGEILGFSGLVGSGRSETMRAIFGLEPCSGKMYLCGKEITVKNPQDAKKKGIAMVNEDRKNFGLCLFRSIRENISLPSLMKKPFFINGKNEKSICLDMARQLSIKMASLEEDAFSLSGGNQQKTVLAKWIMTKPKLLIMDEPTRGVDVNAKAEIHRLICSLAAEGMAIIMVSSELPEVLGMSDRILIYHEGRINGEVCRAQVQSGEVDQAYILAREFGIAGGDEDQ